VTTQNNNSALGYSAGDYYSFSNGTFVGCAAYPSTSGYSNIMGLGYNARPGGNNYVAIGNTSVSTIAGQVSFSTYSDRRFKKNIQENVPGIAFIRLLRPVTYNFKVNDLAKALKEDQRRDENGNIVSVEPDAFTQLSRDEGEGVIRTGFIAQEVEEAAKKLGYDFSGVDAPKNADDFYRLRYSDFVVPLVKAVQEQQEIIELQNQKLEEMQKQIAELKALMQK
jgi:trimeric autotransporter adhesin